MDCDRVGILVCCAGLYSAAPHNQRSKSISTAIEIINAGLPVGEQEISYGSHLRQQWALWALVLSENGGHVLLVNALFAIGVLLLLIWRPGTSPNSSAP